MGNTIINQRRTISAKKHSKTAHRVDPWKIQNIPLPCINHIEIKIISSSPHESSFFLGQTERLTVPSQSKIRAGDRVRPARCGRQGAAGNYVSSVLSGAVLHPSPACRRACRKFFTFTMSATEKSKGFSFSQIIRYAFLHASWIALAS